MRGTVTVAAVFAAFSLGCSTTGTGHGLTTSPQDPATPSPTGSPTPSPTAFPGPDGPLETGAASVSLTGDLIAQIGFPTLIEPDVWSAPPGAMDLGWDEPGGQSLRIVGTSFASRATTSDDRILSLAVDGPDGPVDFTSSTGECSITITPALPDNVGGLFTCASLTDVTGAFTVEARGTFSATG